MSLLQKQPLEISATSDLEVQLTQYTGGDHMVVAAAKVSTSNDVQQYIDANPDDNAGLIRFLVRNRHSSPLEHGLLTFYVRAPIFVFREWHRHRVWSFNEESARYKEMQPLFWVPSIDRKLEQVGKPGHYTFIESTPELWSSTVNRMVRAYTVAYEEYKAMLEEGVAREVARSVLPVGLFSTMWATCNPRNLLAFLSLRTTDEDSMFPSYPQAEIEEAARKMEDEFANLWPITYNAWNTYGRVSP